MKYVIFILVVALTCGYCIYRGLSSDDNAKKLTEAVTETFKDGVNDVVKDVKGKSSDAVDSVKEKAEDLKDETVSTVKSRANDVKVAAKEKFNKAKDSVVKK